MPENTELEYAGFWIRVVAHIIDSILFMAIIMPVMYQLYGDQLAAGIRPGTDLTYILINYVFPAVAVILFWRFKSATPGKMIIGAKIVDDKTGGRPSTIQLIVRYFGYFLSIIPLFLGMLWVAWDSKKQGWHDMVAGTVVVRSTRSGTRPVRFGED